MNPRYKTSHSGSVLALVFLFVFNQPTKEQKRRDTFPSSHLSPKHCIPIDIQKTTRALLDSVYNLEAHAVFIMNYLYHGLLFHWLFPIFTADSLDPGLG